ISHMFYLYPYTTLFRSLTRGGSGCVAERDRGPEACRAIPLGRERHAHREAGQRETASLAIRHTAALEVGEHADHAAHTPPEPPRDRKSTRLNSSHVKIS